MESKVQMNQSITFRRSDLFIVKKNNKESEKVMKRKNTHIYWKTGTVVKLFCRYTERKIIITEKVQIVALAII